MSTRKRRDDDFTREIEAHIQLEVDRLIEDGMEPDRAAVEARRRFGNTTRVRERHYESGRALWLEHLRNDLRCALRSLRRYPVAAAVAVLSLAAGIGAATVTLAVRDTVFHKPPPLYRNPEQLSRVLAGSADRPLAPFSAVPGGLYQIWRAQIGSSVVGAAPGTERDVRTADRSASLPVRAASPDLFAQLGVAPAIGSDFSPLSANRADGSPVVLSHQIWLRLFDGRPDVVGRPLWIDGEPHVVVGVMPQPFWFGEMSAPIWTRLDERTLEPDQRLDVVFRREPPTTMAGMQAALERGLADYTRALPANNRNWRVSTQPMKGTPLGAQVSFVLPYVLAASVLLTFLIACANVAILMIAQWTAREHEIAIRAAIGANRGRIVRSLLTESLVVALLGAVLGIGAVIALRAWIVSRAGEANLYDLSVDPRIFAQVAVIAVATGILTGIAPALYETRRLQSNPLRAMAGSDRVRQRLRHALVVFEIAVTVALLVQTTSMLDGYRRAASPDLGYDTRPLAIVRVANRAGVPLQQTMNALRLVPGVAAVGASTTAPPFALRRPREIVSADHADPAPLRVAPIAVTDGFFDALGVPMRAGRPFVRSDLESGGAVVLGESLARQLFGERSAVGGRVRINGNPHDVVGVVADYSTNPLRLDGRDPMLFVPLVGAPDMTRLGFVVRAAGDPAAVIRSVRRGLPGAPAGTTVSGAFGVDEILDVSGREILVGTAPLFPLIAIGVLLTTMGIYGVLAFAFTRRSRELAVRVAVGAGASDMVRLVATQTARLVCIGGAIGLAVTFALSRVVKAGGGGGSIFDPPAVAFAVPILICVAIGLVATWIPARRALKIDPVVLLKAA